MKYKIRILIDFMLAALLIVTDIIGYWSIPGYIIELTCISNFTIGIILIISGIRMLKRKKDFPNIVYSTGLVTIMLVFFICLGSLSGMYRMNFQGAFLFLHVINPILVLLYYIIFINEKQNGKLRTVLLTPIFSISYLLIDYIVGSIANKFVYGFFEPGELNIVMAIVVGAIIYALLLIIGYTVFFINRLFRKSKNHLLDYENNL